MLELQDGLHISITFTTPHSLCACVKSTVVVCGCISFLFFVHLILHKVDGPFSCLTCFIFVILEYFILDFVVKVILKDLR